MLWFPTYVQQITDSEREAKFNTFCHRETPDDASLYDYCGCRGTTFHDQNFTNANFTKFTLTHSTFHGVRFTNVTFTDSVFESCNFTDCYLEDVRFGSESYVIDVRWERTVFVRVNVSELGACEGEVGGSGEG